MNMKNNSRSTEAHDEIHSILKLAGVFSPQLDRLERISSEMREVEWKLMRRAAATCHKSRPMVSAD